MSVIEYYKKSSFNPVPIKFAGRSNIKTLLKKNKFIRKSFKIYLPF